MTPLKQEVLRQIGQQLAKLNFERLSPPEQTEIFMALGVPISLDPKASTCSEEEYRQACQRLHQLQQLCKK